jgi:Rrf2 family protein
MKLSSQEEYGLRCLLRIARAGRSLTIPEIGKAEGLSEFYTAKLVRILRRGGVLVSARGQAGGYRLARPAPEIPIGEVLALLGGRIFDPAFCAEHSGIEDVCTNSTDCSIRSLWRAVQKVVDRVLQSLTLDELVAPEAEMEARVLPLVQVASPPATASEAGRPSAG